MARTKLPTNLTHCLAVEVAIHRALQLNRRTITTAPGPHRRHDYMGENLFGELT